MRPQILIAAAAAALLLPAAALAAPGPDPALAAFRSLCWKTSANYPAVMQSADADGWTSADLVADDMPGVSITDKGAREKVGASSDMRLLATRGTKGDVVVQTCTISAKQSPDGLLDQAKSWLGAPSSSDAGEISYLVTVDNGKIVPLAQGDIEGAVAKGGVHVIKFRQDSDGETLDYTRFSK